MSEETPVNETRHEAMQYASLSDYLRVIRRRRWMVLGFTVGFALLAFGISIAQSPRYEATAQVKFSDPLADLSFINDTAPTTSPVVLSAEQADLVTRPEATRIVKRKLKTDLPPAELADSISTQVGVQTNLVSITGEAGDAKFAADLANAYAETAVKLGTEDQDRRFKTVVEGLERQIDEVRDLKLEEGEEILQISPLRQQLAEVQVLRDASEPVEIVSRASEPEAPVSPATKRNTFIGAILGFVFGLIAAFVRDALDRRLHSPQQVHEELGVPILGRITESAMRYPGLVKDGSPAMPDTDFEAFRALRMNIASLATDREAPRTILVTSPLPEDGKSSVSVALASAAALTKQRVLLVECDLRRPSLARRLGINREPGLSDFLQGTATPQEILQTVELTLPANFNGEAGQSSAESAARLVVITAGTPAPNPAELLIGPTFEAFIEKVAKVYDLVVLDSSPMLAVVDALEIAQQVDGVLVCARLRSTTRDQLRAARSALKGLEGKPMGAVVTGMRRGDSDAYDYYYGY